MGKRLKWWQIAGLVIDLIGAILLVLSILTDSSDDLLLPIALGCIVVANGLQLVGNIRYNKKK